MSNTNRDYAIVYDVKNSSLVLSRPLNFYITDKNTSNIFVRLVTIVDVGNGIDQYTDLEPASNYALTMRVIKPNNEVKSIEATQHEPESIFQFDLTEGFKDIPGKYICELTISTIVKGRQELITSDPFSYEVKRSILSNVGEIIETEDVTVEKLLNNLDATKAELSSQIKDKANKDEVFTMANMGQDIKEAMTGGSVAVVGKNTVSAENIVDKQVTMNKVLVDYDFLPRVLYFKRRSYSNGLVENTIGATNLASNLIYINNEEDLRLRFDDTKFLCVIRLFNTDGNLVVDRNINTNNYNLTAFFKEKQSDNPLCYAIYVKDKDGNALDDSYKDTLSSYIYIEDVRKKPITIDYIGKINQDKKKIFNEGNFSLNLIGVNEDNQFYLKDDISTTVSHKWFAYLDTDRTKKINRISATIYPEKANDKQFRLFIEGSDKRNIFFNFQIKNATNDTYDLSIDGYQIDSYNASLTMLNRAISNGVSVALPYEPCKVDLIVEGKIINVYVNSKFICTYNGRRYINENINRCGINFRGDKTFALKFSDLKVSYQQDKIVNYTIDDTYEILTRLNNLESDNLFDDPTFKLLKTMHDEYGFKITLFVFYAKHDKINLSSITTKFKQQFIECSSWLKFGYHSQYEDTYSTNLTTDKLIANIEETYSAIANFACEDSISRFTRFGYFNVSQEQLIELRKRNLICGVFTADDDRTSNCGLTGGALTYVQNYSHFVDLENDIHYFKTTYRFDGYTKQQVLDALYARYENINTNSYISCFAHSIQQHQLEGVCEFVSKRKDLSIDFVENRI